MAQTTVRYLRRLVEDHCATIALQGFDIQVPLVSLGSLGRVLEEAFLGVAEIAKA